MIRGKTIPRRRAAPSIFKTHLSYKTIGNYPCKYIHNVRDGKDVAVSYYYHYLNLMGYRVSFTDFYHAIFLKGRYQNCSWFEHVHDWYQNKEGLDILYIKYEDMKTNLKDTIQEVIDFCGFQVDKIKLEQVAERSSFAFMKTHEEKFDLAMEYLYQRGITPGKFLRKGETGGWREYFNETQKIEYMQQYNNWLTIYTNLNYGI